ncbi:MAG: hypothetical protein ABIV48_07135 [Pyrinomonadaceae bacterium]
MKSNRSNFTLLFCLFALLSIGIGCGSSSSTNNSSVNAGTSNTAANSTNVAPSAAPERQTVTNLAGEYDATGTNPDGGSPYTASLSITPRDDVYQFSWTSGKNDYDGVGVSTDTAVAVAYTTGKNGEGCGVVLYKVNPDGSLDGKVGYWGENKMETEKAIRKTGSDIEGDYEISGKNPDGQEYSGNLTIKKSGLGYEFKWSAPEALEGFGIRAGNLIAVGFGGKQCSFVGYDINANGTLEGQWGFKTSKSLGTEIAKKR